MQVEVIPLGSGAMQVRADEEETWNIESKKETAGLPRWVARFHGLDGWDLLFLMGSQPKSSTAKACT